MAAGARHGYVLHTDRAGPVTRARRGHCTNERCGNHKRRDSTQSSLSWMRVERGARAAGTRSSTQDYDSAGDGERVGDHADDATMMPGRLRFASAGHRPSD
jgi:hypothetical protein